MAKRKHSRPQVFSDLHKGNFECIQGAHWKYFYGYIFTSEGNNPFYWNEKGEGISYFYSIILN